MTELTFTLPREISINLQFIELLLPGLIVGYFLFGFIAIYLIIYRNEKNKNNKLIHKYALVLSLGYSFYWPHIIIGVLDELEEKRQKIKQLEKKETSK